MPDIVRMTIFHTATQWGHQLFAVCHIRLKDTDLLPLENLFLHGWYCSIFASSADICRLENSGSLHFFSRRFHGTLVDLVFFGTPAGLAMHGRHGFTDAADNHAKGELGEHLRVFFRPQEL